ncbi:MAG: acyl-homoserine-lactone acylase [Sphingomonas sp. 28-66-16]|nr:MAG: acyl-homoserine-lactone acylase [Sphingomonas sp. 28-66-16]
MRKSALGAIGVALIAGGLVGDAALAKGPRFEARITRTSYGIPHILARDWAGAGYGVGYAYAQDNLCLLAEEFATVAGDRSRHFGPKQTATLGFDKVDNLSSDIFFRAMIDLPALRASLARRPAKERALLEGYVAGYNRHLRDIGAKGVPEACRGKAWVKPITTDDMLRVAEKQVLLASSLALAPYIVNAAPPGKPQASITSTRLPGDPTIGWGSNGWAFGAEVTDNGRGLVVGNPHFPWEGPSRFWEMQITIPGEIDAMGVGLAGTPLVALGFNKDVAWTHTVTAAQHFTGFELKIDPADPTRYLVDGTSEKMRATEISVPMPGGAAPVTRTLYSTRFGPVITIPFIGMAWKADKAFAIRDANYDNDRSITAWIAIGKARSVAEVKAAVSSTLGIPWVNTIAADRAGNVLHADVTAAPNVSIEKAKACATPLSASVAGRFVLLDGSRSSCDWDDSPGTAGHRLMPAADQAIWERRDYVANSNDSYWLSNAGAPYRQLSPVLGPWGTARTLRTRSGLVEIARRFDGSDGLGGTKVDQAKASEMILANKSLAAELALPAIRKLCAGEEKVAAACAALGTWDGRFNLDSRGAVVFSAFWPAASRVPGIWQTAFDPADPVHTPRDFTTAGEAGAKLLGVLADTQAKLIKDGFALDARWGDTQFAIRGDEHIPIHGADGQLGVLNVQMSKPEAGGLVPYHGSSYIQVVTFDDKGPVADAVLSYSQSTDPASPHFADQTRLYSAKKWVRLPFTPAEIRASADGPAVTIRE